MMVSRGSVILSLCGFIAFGALATACSSSSATSPSTNAQVASYCDTLCTRASGCDRGIDKQTCTASCANQNAAVLPKLRQDVVGLITSCVDRKDCKDILTTNVAPTCSAEAAASVAPSALATEVCQSLETAQKKCGVAFDMAACLSRMKLYSEETLGQARTCAGKACTDVVACVDATLGSLAGYSTGGIELDAGKPTPDVTVDVADGGTQPADATIDAPGLDAGPTPGDAGTGTTEGGPVPPEAGPGPGPSDAAVDACAIPVTVPPTHSGAYCPFSRVGDGGNVTCASQSEKCCHTALEAGVPSSCVPLWTSCDTVAPGSTVWECDSKLDCTGGKYCCTTGVNAGPSKFCNNTFFGPGVTGTSCIDSCGQSDMACFTDGDCTDGRKCLPLSARGKQMGICAKPWVP